MKKMLTYGFLALAVPFSAFAQYRVTSMGHGCGQIPVTVKDQQTGANIQAQIEQGCRAINWGLSQQQQKQQALTNLGFTVPENKYALVQRGTSCNGNTFTLYDKVEKLEIGVAFSSSVNTCQHINYHDGRSDYLVARRVAELTGLSDPSYRYALLSRSGNGCYDLSYELYDKVTKTVSSHTVSGNNCSIINFHGGGNQKLVAEQVARHLGLQMGFPNTALQGPAQRLLNLSQRIEQNFNSMVNSSAQPALYSQISASLADMKKFSRQFKRLVSQGKLNRAKNKYQQLNGAFVSVAVQLWYVDQLPNQVMNPFKRFAKVMKRVGNRI